MKYPNIREETLNSSLTTPAPPKEELEGAELVPQDVRERKGCFYTPKIWVELSQKYLSDVFGTDWQDEYYIWDCAAGTGNLLAGLTNKYRIWASTLDKADVDVMKDRIQNGANLLESHVFQFDFLNDDFSKLPKGLQDIINDPKQRKKLIVYINPPYAEAASKETISGIGENKKDVAVTSKVYAKYLDRTSFSIPATNGKPTRNFITIVLPIRYLAIIFLHNMASITGFRSWNRK